MIYDFTAKDMWEFIASLRFPLSPLLSFREEEEELAVK